MKHLFQRPLFNMLQRQHPDFEEWMASKLVVLNGDLVLPRCGLSGAEYDLVRAEVNYIIHSAASTSFSEPLTSLLKNNYWVRSACNADIYVPL